ncbi:hypothetical protein BKA66DRAFT_63532 [Pyrenochaeta sp. MPI-SDFR-AT-0127]|nr:hypothetical protein BKA66DRAFT_63532 [Pyrenochaeta sp. MPI-SDFR-AT-0127]
MEPINHISPLLNLPTELRLCIYHHVDYRSRPCSFRGLLFSCKLIHHEVESELCNEISSAVTFISEAIRLGGDEILYTPPDTLSGWLNLTVSRPKKANMFHKEDPFLRFKYIHFNTFTITFHNHEEGFEFRPERPDTYQYAAGRVATEIGRWGPIEDVPAMKRWNIVWRAYPLARARIFMDAPLRRYHKTTWEMEEFKNEQGLLTGVSFSRIRKSEEARKCEALSKRDG